MFNTTFISNFLLQSDIQQEWLMVSDKVNSLLVILLIIFGGVIAYLFLTGRKVSKLEAQLKELEK
ncbi:MAG: CcmD family protein [Bacteroidota bacterium]